MVYGNIVRLNGKRCTVYGKGMGSVRCSVTLNGKCTCTIYGNLNWKCTVHNIW